MTRHHSCRVSPFGHPRIHARLTAPRGITQPPTSFIGSQCQGIHHAPLHTYNTKNQRKIRNYTTTNHTTHAKPQRAQRKPQPPTRESHVRLDARNHYPRIKHHTPPPRWSDNRHPPPGRPAPPPTKGASPRACCLRTQQCVRRHHPPQGSSFFVCRRAPDPRPLQTGAIQRIAQNTEPPHGCGRAWVSWCSLERR